MYSGSGGRVRPVEPVGVDHGEEVAGIDGLAARAEDERRVGGHDMDEHEEGPFLARRFLEGAEGVEDAPPVGVVGLGAPGRSEQHGPGRRIEEDAPELGLGRGEAEVAVDAAEIGRLDARRNGDEPVTLALEEGHDAVLPDHGVERLAVGGRGPGVPGHVVEQAEVQRRGQGLMGQIEVGIAAAGDRESAGLEAGEEGGVIERKHLLQDVPARVRIEDEVVDIGTPGGGSRGLDLRAGGDSRLTGQGMRNGGDVEKDERRRNDVQNDG